MTALSLLSDTVRLFWPHTVHSAQSDRAVVAVLVSYVELFRRAL